MMVGLRSLSWVFIALLLTQAVFAQSDDSDQGDASSSAGNGVNYRSNGGFFGELGFGAGIGFVDDVSDVSRVQEAIVDPNGIVRITKQQNDAGRLLLEMHALRWVLDEWECECRHGPFVAVSSSDDEIIKGIGFGWMLGIPFSAGALDTFNVGLGAFSDSNVQMLGNGIIEDMPLPAGESEIRYKEREKWGVLLMFSFGVGGGSSSN